jgi:hypothetical protein
MMIRGVRFARWIAVILIVTLGACEYDANEEAAPSAASGGPLRTAVPPRTAQVCPGPALPPTGCFTVDTSIIGGKPFADYQVTKPTAILFDTERRRAELGAMDPIQAAQYCSANPNADEVAGLPSVTFTSVKVSIFETQLGGGNSRQSADLELAGVQTSDGYSLPKFGAIWNQQRGLSSVSLQYRPSIDPNVQGIEGLTEDYQFTVDVNSGAVTFSNTTQLPVNLRRLMLAVAYRLPDIYASATSVEVRAGSVLPLWTMPEVINVATTFSMYGFSVAQPTFTPIVTLNCDLFASGGSCNESLALNNFRDYMVHYGADYLYSNRRETAAGILANLRAWANADALSKYTGIVIGQPNQPDFRPKYDLAWVLVPMVKTWSMVRKDPLATPADVALIDAWFDRRIAYATEPNGGPQYDDNPFNVGYLVRGLAMAWGVVKGDNLAFARGIERLYMGLNQMRTDGSFPREVARGACALHYQDTMLLNLLFIAEVAQEQGYDAYGITLNGKSLHTAVKFLLDAVDDPAVALAYSSQDATNCIHAEELPFLLSTVVQAPGGFTWSAWLEPYMARFPDHPNTPRVAKLLQGGLAKNRPIFHPHSGGNTTCFSANSAPQLPTRKIECTFNWALATYPEYLPSPASASRSLGPYFYREFGGGQSYLGVSFTDQHLYYLNRPTLVDLGPMTQWIANAQCQ